MTEQGNMHIVMNLPAKPQELRTDHKTDQCLEFAIFKESHYVGVNEEK